MGSLWLQGEGAPSSGDGGQDDFWLDTDTGDIYGPKGSGGWGGVVFNIAEGQQGPPGVQGPAGIQGIQGQQGIQGIQGIQGEIGPQGPIGSSGNGWVDFYYNAFEPTEPGATQFGYDGTYVYFENSGNVIGGYSYDDWVSSFSTGGSLYFRSGSRLAGFDWSIIIGSVSTISSTWVRLQISSDYGTAPSIGNDGQPFGIIYIPPGPTGPPGATGMLTGMVMPYAGQSLPADWLWCDGSSVSRTTYASLFAAIGTTYGTVDASSFNLPDLRGRVIAGRDNMENTVGTGGGSANRLTAATLDGVILGNAGGVQTHSHTITRTGASTTATGGSATRITSVTTPTGSASSLQPTIILNYIIKI